jgi:hypothetical protein
MTEIFSENNHDNANTFLLVLISVVLLGCLVFYLYKIKQNKKKYNNLNNSRNNIQTTGFISF